jgi:predicted Zn-dependent protease DUF2268
MLLMTVRFHLLDAFDEIPADDRIAILAALETALPKVLGRLAIDRVDIVIGYSDPFWTIPAWGIGGYAHGKGRISITAAPNHPRFGDPERGERLAAVLAHELHHLARARGPGYGRTLGEALVSEGLAQCFEVETGCPPPPYAVAVQGDALRQLARRARNMVDADEYDHGAWFFGRRGDPDFPRDGGYSLGYLLAGRWLSLQSTTAAAAVNVPASQLIEAWTTGRIDL